MTYLWVAIGSAIGGVLRYAIARWMEPVSAGFPWGTFVVNVLGCFVIGYFGTLTLAGGRYTVAESWRVFVMVGICGGFTTFSSFSLQTFERLRNGAGGVAAAYVLASVVVCLAGVWAGHALAQRLNDRVAIVQTVDEIETG
jgi:CrcB protein